MANWLWSFWVATGNLRPCLPGPDRHWTIMIPSLPSVFLVLSWIMVWTRIWYLTAGKIIRPSEANDASFSNFFILHFSLSSSLLPPCPSFLPFPPSSLSLLPPSHSLLFVPLFFLVQHCLNHLESVKIHFSSILKKALRTNQPTDHPMDKASYRCEDASNKAQRGQWCVL